MGQAARLTVWLNCLGVLRPGQYRTGEARRLQTLGRHQRRRRPRGLARPSPAAGVGEVESGGVQLAGDLVEAGVIRALEIPSGRMRRKRRARRVRSDAGAVISAQRRPLATTQRPSDTVAGWHAGPPAPPKRRKNRDLGCGKQRANPTGCGSLAGCSGIKDPQAVGAMAAAAAAEVGPGTLDAVDARTHSQADQHRGRSGGAKFRPAGRPSADRKRPPRDPRR